jgi:hypothetical protein
MISSIPIEVHFYIYRYSDEQGPYNATLIAKRTVSVANQTFFRDHLGGDAYQIGQYSSHQNLVENISLTDIPPSTGVWNYIVEPQYYTVEAPNSNGYYTITSNIENKTVYVKETEFEVG